MFKNRAGALFYVPTVRSTKRRKLTISRSTHSLLTTLGKRFDQQDHTN